MRETLETFNNNIFILGYGSVSKCFIPLIFKHIRIKPSRITVMDFVDCRSTLIDYIHQGMRFVQEKITENNYLEILSKYLRPGDLFIDLSWNVNTLLLVDWAHKHNVLYINTSVEVWDPSNNDKSIDPRELTLYKRQVALRNLKETWSNKHGATAILDHGANPGLVSHFVKQGLIDISEKVLSKAKPNNPRDNYLRECLDRRLFPEMARCLGVKTIHISERDTQIVSRPKEVNEFVNTWSIQGLIEEATAPAEIGWGSHEKELPPGGMFLEENHEHNHICLTQRGMMTWVQSWVPSGPITGMVIRHGESCSISGHLSVREGNGEVYRPTVHYAYCPCDSTICSLHEFSMRGLSPQPAQRLLTDEIIKGSDELGCLIMGHDLNAWWIGSDLSIEESRKLVPGQNATTVQVAIGVIAAMIYAISYPNKGLCLPDDLDYEFILPIAKPYLGSFISMQTDWSPLDKINDFRDFNRQLPPPEDKWQFTTFLVSQGYISENYTLYQKR